MEANELIKEIISMGKSALNDPAPLERSKEVLVDFIKKEALFKGEFVLSSGKKSNYYLDLRKVTLSSQASFFIGYLVISKALQLDEFPEGIAGPTLGADPIISSAVTVAPLFQLNLKGLIVRKAKKEHGLGKLIEGDEEKVEKLVVVEDVVTTGGSLFEAIEVLKNAGKKVLAAIPVVDREEADVGGRLFKMGIKYLPLIKISEIL